MRLVLFVNKGAPAKALRVGALVGDASVADVTDALADAGHGVVTSMRIFLELGAAGRAVAERAVSDAIYHRPRALVQLRAPIYDP